MSLYSLKFSSIASDLRLRISEAIPPAPKGDRIQEIMSIAAKAWESPTPKKTCKKLFSELLSASLTKPQIELISTIADSIFPENRIEPFSSCFSSEIELLEPEKKVPKSSTLDEETNVSTPLICSPELEEDKSQPNVRTEWGKFELIPASGEEGYYLEPELGGFFEKNKGNGIVDALAKFSFRHHKSIREFSFIASPDTQALIATASWYKQKYNVDIQMVQCDRLSEKISLIQNDASKPMFIGFIVSQNVLISHVAPMIGYFQPNQPPKLLLMDVLGENFGSFVTDVAQGIESSSASLCWYAGSVRQADHYSCRIGAVVLLRNALLSLNESEAKGKEMWDKIWKKEGRVEALPPEWTYDEQIQFSTKEDREKIVVLRDKFSTQEAKRTSPQSLEEKKQKKSEIVTFEYRFTRSAAWFGGLEKIEKIPEGMKIEYAKGGQEVTCIFEIKRKINTALVRKGLRWFEEYVKKTVKDLITSRQLHEITTPEKLAEDLFRMPLSATRKSFIVSCCPAIEAWFKFEDVPNQEMKVILSKQLQENCSFLFPVVR